MWDVLAFSELINNSGTRPKNDSLFYYFGRWVKIPLFGLIGDIANISDKTGAQPITLFNSSA